MDFAFAKYPKPSTRPTAHPLPARRHTGSQTRLTKSSTSGFFPSARKSRDRFRAQRFQFWARWLSGRKRFFAKEVNLKRVPWVRIPLSPPFKTKPSAASAGGGFVLKRSARIRTQLECPSPRQRLRQNPSVASSPHGSKAQPEINPTLAAIQTKTVRRTAMGGFV